MTVGNISLVYIKIQQKQLTTEAFPTRAKPVERAAVSTTSSRKKTLKLKLKLWKSIVYLTQIVAQKRKSCKEFHLKTSITSVEIFFQKFEV